MQKILAYICPVKNWINKSMGLNEIRDRLIHGDNKRICQLTGFTETYVSLVLNGKRKSNRIIRTAERIIEERERSDRAIQKEKI